MENKIPKKRDSKWVKKLKQKIYTWHRTIGIITVVPVIFWCLSGVMHPFMAHFFKPQIANERLEKTTIAPADIPLSIQTVLAKNNLKQIKNFRIVSFNKDHFYQVKNVDNVLHYYNTATASELVNGDAKYAEYLSRYFLNDQESKVVSSEVLTEFDSQYKYVNRYLPVYKVSFEREDEMQVYVETSSSKLATFNPKSRQFFIWFFDVFHNWSFLDAITNNTIRVWTMIVLLSIVVLSALSGIVIYGLFWKVFKKQVPATDSKTKLRFNHRKVGIAVAFVTLTFALSGAYHAFSKLKPNNLSSMVYEPTIDVAKLSLENNKLAIDWSSLLNSSVIKLKDVVYYQIVLKAEEKKTQTIYVNAENGSVNKNGELEYVQYLATYFSDKMNGKGTCCDMQEPEDCEASTDISTAKLIETKTLYDFEKREYGFVNKRLPVVKLAYETPEKVTYYIEPSSSHLAAVITNTERLEGYSFAIFHKFLFMDWAGKGIRDLVTVIAAVGILTICILGLLLFLKNKKE
jgi:uncharacterized iron-regulated membrane protein